MEEHCYIISYDLSEPSRNYDGLISAIKRFTMWGRLTESTWAVVSSNTAIEIRDALSSHIDSDDKLIVIRSGRAAAWTKCLADNNWIKENIVK